MYLNKKYHIENAIVIEPIYSISKEFEVTYNYIKRAKREQNMKIALITIHDENNYGVVLQAYATKKYGSLGFQVKHDFIKK